MSLRCAALHCAALHCTACLLAFGLLYAALYSCTRIRTALHSCTRTVPWPHPISKTFTFAFRFSTLVRNPSAFVLLFQCCLSAAWKSTSPFPAFHGIRLASCGTCCDIACSTSACTVQRNARQKQRAPGGYCAARSPTGCVAPPPPPPPFH